MDYRTRMRNIREDRDLTQKQVGEIINKSQQGYNHIETGRAELKIVDLSKLGQFSNVSDDCCIGLTDQESVRLPKHIMQRCFAVLTLLCTMRCSNLSYLYIDVNFFGDIIVLRPTRRHS